jgi:uncharacterized protein
MYFDKKISATMCERKRMRFTLDLKSVDMQGQFAGYASVFNVVDNQRDIMVRGAFSRTVKDRITAIKLLWQHQQEEPIGIFDQFFEDKNGLYVEGRLLLSVQRAKEAHTLLKAGAISGLSIGYSPVRYTIDPDSGVRRLTEVELWEISLVTFPANANAQVTVVKQDEDYEWKQALRAGQVIALAQALDRAIGVLRI